MPPQRPSAGRGAFSLGGLVRAPSLQTDEERTASRLELFFDLAFVLVIAELAGALRHDVTWHGVGTPACSPPPGGRG